MCGCLFVVVDFVLLTASLCCGGGCSEGALLFGPSHF